jgi:hypothetical protein
LLTCAFAVLMIAPREVRVSVPKKRVTIRSRRILFPKLSMFIV